MSGIKLFFGFIFLYISHHAQDFDKIHALKNTTIFTQYSENVQDSFNIYVKLPDGYFDSTKSYPVVYVTDGDQLFQIVCGMLPYMNFPRYMPDAILVGIGYGTLDWQSGNNRSRDFTGKAAPGRDYEGGAPNFLKFITDELVPQIDNKYRTEKSDRTLVGHSLGGQFVVYAFLNSPNTFSKYLASSPFLFRIKGFYHGLVESNAEEINRSQQKIFISVGENELEEEYKNTIGEFVDRLGNKLTSNTKLKYQKISEGTHFLNPPIAMAFGLKWLFEDEQQ